MIYPHHSNLPFKPVSTRHHRLFDAGWWHIHFSRPWHQCLSFIAAWYHLQILATRSVLTGGRGRWQWRTWQSPTCCDSWCVCLCECFASFFHWRFLRKWEVLTYFDYILRFWYEFSCKRVSYRVKRPFPKKMGNVQIVQKMPVGWACNLSRQCANWGSGSQNTALILKYPWPSVWYAYRYRILKCNYHCIHPKICKVLIQSYHTNISFISISTTWGAKTTTYLSSRKANWSIMVCFSMSLWNYARLMWSCWCDWFATVHGGTVSMWEMSMPLKGAWTRTNMKRFESVQLFWRVPWLFVVLKDLW